MPEVRNIYELLGFLIVAALQVYTRWSVGQLAKKQELANTQHDVNRAHLLRLVAHATSQVKADMLIGREEVKAALEGAMRVAYYQGQADAGTERPYPEERVKAAVLQMIEIVEHAAGNGGGVSASTAKAAEEMVKVAMEARNGGGPPGSPPIQH